MRTILDLIVVPEDQRLKIHAVDEPSFGGASHLYRVNDSAGNALELALQKGPQSENGFNGFTEAVLLTILIDRLRTFQNGQYSCRENALALTHCEDALHWLNHRTMKRMQRGVEGTGKA